jgi:hypothetical protein
VTAGIYAINDFERGVPVYVGRSKNIERRIKQHLKDWISCERNAILDGCIEAPFIRSKKSLFSLLAIEGLPFDWEVIEETNDLEKAESFWIDELLSSGVQLANGYGTHTMQGRALKLPCPYSEKYGVGPAALCYVTKVRIEQTYLLKRLKRDEPALAEKVVSGELSAHAAAVAAGIKKRLVQIEPTPDGFAKAIEKHLPGWTLVRAA